jgi:protein-disulfide isomerase
MAREVRPSGIPKGHTEIESMKSKTLLIAILVLVIAALPALAKKKEKTEPAAAPAAAAATGGGDVVAYVGGEPITKDDVDKLASRDLMRLKQQEFDIRRNYLDQLIQKKLQEKEAAARGVALADLLKTEIEDKTAKPTEDELKQFYDQNKARMGNRTYDQAKPDLERALMQQKSAARRAEFNKELMTKANVRVLLEPPRVKVSIPEGWPTKGPATAPVTLVEFSDYQCPFCKRADPTVQEILKTYGDKVRFAYRDYPLSFHQRAMPASIAAHCAKDQNKYWEMHQNLMTEQGDLSDDDLKKRAGAVGLDAAAFGECYSTERHKTLIQAAFDDGVALGVTGTPSFFINGRMLVGAKPIEEFKAIIDEEIQRASGGAASSSAK